MALFFLLVAAEIEIFEVGRRASPAGFVLEGLMKLTLMACNSAFVADFGLHHATTRPSDTRILGQVSRSVKNVSFSPKLLNRGDVNVLTRCGVPQCS